MIKLGGVTKAFEAANLAEKLGMSVNLSGAICETSVSSAAVVHLAAAIPQIKWRLSVTNQYANMDIVQNPVKIINGKINVPPGIGLGVEVDKGAVRRLERH
jgi:L-alanine-DL-glutamate epimerase-like enolase superfamily enzyme